MKFVSMLFMLPLADQGENLQNFTSFCRTIIEVQEISGKAQFKAWKSPQLILSPLFLVRKSHCHVFLGGLDPGQAPLKTLLLMLRLT